MKTLANFVWRTTLVVGTLIVALTVCAIVTGFYNFGALFLSPTPTVVPAVEAPPPADSPECPYTQEWFQQVLSETNDTASLIATLGNHWDENQGAECQGSWGQPEFKVPAHAVFWTDLLAAPPVTLEVIRNPCTQCGWGVFKANEDGFVIPADNAGGRFIVLK